MSTDQHLSPGAGAATDGTATDDTAADTAVELALADANVAGSLGEYARAWLKRVKGGDTGLLPVIAGLIVIAIIFQSLKSTFLSADNIVNLIQEASYFVVWGMAEVFVLLLGEIDLSAGYVGFCGAAIAVILVAPPNNQPWWLAVIAGLALCAVVGAIQGLLVTRLKLPSFVVTLGGLLAFQGVLLLIFTEFGQGQGSVSLPHSGPLYALVNGRISPTVGWVIMIVLVLLYAAVVLGRDHRRRAAGLVAPPLGLTLLKIGAAAAGGIVLVAVCNVNTSALAIIKGNRGLPWGVIVILAIAAGATFLLSRTRFGRYVYAVGGNAEAARRAGINLSRIRLIGFVLCAVIAGLAGLFYNSNVQNATTSVDGGSQVLYAVAAAVIGGTSLFGGRGKIINAVIGGVVIATIYNGMSLLGLQASSQDVVTALVLVAAATVDAVGRRGAASA